jgi:hypothetical protein
MSIGVMKDYKLKLMNLQASDTLGWFFVYYESIKRELKIRPMYECRCDGFTVVYYESESESLKYY